MGEKTVDPSRGDLVFYLVQPYFKTVEGGVKYVPFKGSMFRLASPSKTSSFPTPETQESRREPPVSEVL